MTLCVLFFHIMQESWLRFLSVVVLGVFAAHVEALPKNRGNTGTNAAAAAAPTASTSITKATDGSMILDKTVNIK